MNTIEVKDCFNKTTNKFWCHLCKKEFDTNINNENIELEEDKEIQCKYCNDYFCELIESNLTHPSEFIPFELINNQSHTNRNNINSTTSSSTSTSSLFGSFNPMSDIIMLQRNNQNTNTNQPRTSSNLLDVILSLLIL